MGADAPGLPEKTNPLLLNHLILTSKLHSYLASLNEQAQDRYQLIIKSKIINT